MAGLPPDGRYLIQQNDGVVTIFDSHTQAELLRVDPHDGDAMSKAQLAIYQSSMLDNEQKCFAHFWCGYFYGHATAFRRAEL